MDEEGFRKFMKAKGKSARGIDRDVKGIQIFEEYLNTHEPGKTVETVTQKDILDYEPWARQHFRIQPFWPLRNYYLFIGNTELSLVADALQAQLWMENYKLKDFMGVDSSHIRDLSSIGIKTAQDMLDVGKTKLDREQLGLKTKIPIESILKLVKLSNLARLPGVKKKRAKLYYDAGFDTIEKIAQLDPKELREQLRKFIQETSFPGIPPVLGEVANSVALARYLPRIIEW